MTYPVVVFVMAILARGTGMLLFIVPVFAKMFEGLGAELPRRRRSWSTSATS